MTAGKLTIRQDHHLDRRISRAQSASVPSQVKPDEKIDWFRVIVELERSSYQHNAIATFVGVSRRAVGAWKAGSSPRYEDGDLLIALWLQVTGKPREAVPTVSRFDWRR